MEHDNVKGISVDGSHSAFVMEPWDGDSVVKLYDSEAKEKASFQCAAGITFTSDSKFLLFTIKPPADHIRELKLKKTKKEDMPFNKLGIHDINSGRVLNILLRSAGWVNLPGSSTTTESLTGP